MKEHYIVTIDRGHLRIYTEAKSSSQRSPRLEVVEAMDFPGHTTGDEEGATGKATVDQQPLKRRADRRNNEVLAVELDSFLQNRPDASWDFAATPALYRAIIEHLSPETCRRLKRALSTVLVNQRAEDVRAHFATAGR